MSARIGLFIFLLALAAVHSVLGAQPQSEPSEQARATAKPLSGVVVDEQGAPIPRADVLYSWWGENKQQTIDAKSDQQGHFKLSPPQSIADGAWPPGSLWAAKAGRRLQYQSLFEAGKPPPDDLRLVLAPAADVPVTVRGSDGKPCARAKVALPSIVYGEHSNMTLPEALIPFTETTTDERGFARLTALTLEELAEVRVTAGKYGIQSRYVFQQGEKIARPLIISLRATGRIRGRLVAPETDAVEGIPVMLLSYPAADAQQALLLPGAEQVMGQAAAVSDKEGRFEIPALATGVIRHIHVAIKPDSPYLARPPVDMEIGAGQTVEIEIPLLRAVRVHGVVREKACRKPVAGMMISAWEPGANSSSSATTGEDGRFELRRLPGQLYMHLAFSKPREAPGWFSHQFHFVPGGKEDFELPPMELKLATGRVVDDHGRGLPGLKIEKVVTRVETQNGPVENPVLSLSQSHDFATDENGKYGAWVEVGPAYRVQIHAEGRAPRWSEWVKFNGDGAAQFPEVVIDSLHSIAGRVVDRQGHPAPDVKIIQAGDGPLRTETITDAGGRFRLSGYQRESGYVFAEKAGFRFHGQRVKSGDEEVQIVLARTTESPERRLATLHERDAADDAALAMKVLAPALEQKPKGADDRDALLVLRELALIDPAAALDRLEAWGFRGERGDILRLDVAKQWSAEHPDDAMAIIEGLEDAYARASGYVMAAETLPEVLRERKAEWFRKARFHLRGAGDPTMRTALNGYIARLLIESGERDEASKIVAEIKPAAEELPLDGIAAYVRGVVAEALASYDLPAALALIKDLKDDGEYDRHHGNIARIMAASQPAEALRTLKLVRDDFQRNQHATFAACLVTSDQAAADETISLIKRLELRAFAQGLRGLILAKTDAKQARLHLERAYEMLSKLASGDDPHMYGYHAAPVLAAWFLPVVETLAPEQVDEYLWRVMALRLPLAKQGERERTALTSRAYLAMFLSRYDRNLAREVFGDLVGDGARFDPNEFTGAAKGWFAAAAMIDPAWAVSLHDALPDHAPRNLKAQSRHGLVGILSRHGEARWREAADYLMMPLPRQRIQ